MRVLTAWSYAVRAVIAGLRRRPEAPIFRAHARQALFPKRGVSLRDRALRVRGGKRRADRQQDPGDRVLEEPGVAEAVHGQRREHREHRGAGDAEPVGRL